MKKLIKYMVLFLCILLMTGCSDKKSVGGKNITTANSVNKIINEQINNENKDKTTDNVQKENKQFVKILPFFMTLIFFIC